MCVKEVLQQLQPVAPSHRAGMQHHAELPAPLVLRIELRPPVAEQIIGMLEPRALAREHQEPQIIEVIVVGQRQQRAPRRKVRHPVMRNIVRQPVAHILVACADQQIDRMPADRASGERIVLPWQTEPSRRLLSRHARQYVGRQVEPCLLLLGGQPADVLMLQAVRRDFVPIGQQRANPFGAKLCDDRGHGKRRRDLEAPQHGKQPIEPVMRGEECVGMRQIGGADALRTTRHAQIHHDRDATAVAVGPANFVIPQSDFVGDRVALLPGHCALLRSGRGNSRGSAWRLPRRWGTIRRAASSSA